MKSLLYSFTVLLGGAGVVLSQTVLAPPSPALQVTPTTSLVPGGPAIPVGAATAASTGVNGASVVNVNTLATLLANLQTVGEQALPVLANFNDGFDFFSLGSGPAVNNGLAATGTSLANNSGTNFSNNSGRNFGMNLGANVATRTSPSVGVATNAFGIPGGLAVSLPSRETLRALLVLQNDLERLLPLLASLNGGKPANAGLSSGFVPGVFTNTFGGVVVGQ